MAGHGLLEFLGYVDKLTFIYFEMIGTRNGMAAFLHNGRQLHTRGDADQMGSNHSQQSHDIDIKQYLNPRLAF